jgi:hypothetical protein
MLTQDASVIYGFLFGGVVVQLVYPISNHFCVVYHRQIVDALVNRCKALGHTPVRAVLKLTVALLFIFIGVLAAMVFFDAK